MLCEGRLQKFWNPAHPKFCYTPATLKDILFSKYQVKLYFPFWVHLNSMDYSIAM